MPCGIAQESFDNALRAVNAKVAIVDDRLLRITMAGAREQEIEAVNLEDPPDVENPKAHPDPDSNQQKDPDDWVTGNEPMTGAQASYLKTLSEEADAEFPGDNLTKAEASKQIDALKEKLGR